MKNLYKTITSFAVLTLILAANPSYVAAEGLTVSADKESCEIGDRVTVSIDAEGIGDGTVPPDIQVEFAASRLNFEACSVEYGGGGGGLVTFKDKSASVEFTTLSGGAADVTVTATAEDAAEPVSSTVTISVNGEDTAAAASTEESATNVADATIDIGDGRVVQAVFADEFKPVLFHKETMDYKGQTVECAKFDMGDIILLYTTDASGEDGKFMIYDPAKDEFSDCRMIQGIENRFIIVLPDCDGDVPPGYTKAVLDWNGQTLTAFMEESVANGTSVSEGGVDPADFFLVYAISSEGNKGWYRYDKNEGTYQRVSPVSGTFSAEGGSGDDADDYAASGFLDSMIPSNVQTIILLVCAPLALILLITVIVLAVKLHNAYEYDDYYEDDEDEYSGFEDDEDDYYERKRHTGNGVTAASLVGRSLAEDEEDEDEDEEDAEDEDEEDEEDDDMNEDDASDDEEEDEDEEEEDEDDEDDEDERAEDEEDDDEVDDVAIYTRPLSRRERKEREREERWRAKEEKKAAKRRKQGYEEATPMDWSSFNTDHISIEGEEAYKKSTPPKYMTESMEPVRDEADVKHKTKTRSKKEDSAPLPPRKIAAKPEETQKPQVVQEEEQRKRQRRLFEQQQRIEEQRRIEAEQQEAQRQKEQQKFIAARTEDEDLDEDFQFEFLKLN